MSGQPQMNGSVDGGKYIDSIDPDDPEYQRQMQRPADVKEDMTQMEARQRVSLILESKAFRDELEVLVKEQLAQGGNPASLRALQQIADYILPGHKMASTTSRGGGSIIPINDIRGAESLNYSKGEKIVRCKLAATYRMMDMFGWSQGIYSHITARISQDHEHFLINPFGVLYHEVTAASLVKVDMQGDILDRGSTGLGLNKAGYTLHSAIHQARPDLKCVIHLRSSAAVAVSIMKCGLLPISQDALICGEISYYDYTGILLDQSERDILARTLGPSNKVMFLRNHGVVACGSTIEEAFHYACNVMAACDTQMRVIPVGIDNLIHVPEGLRKQTFDIASRGGQGVDSEGAKKKWRPGELEFEAYMRFLDAGGYRTGHMYHEMIRRGQAGPERSNSEVEIPPYSSSYNYMYDENDKAKYQSPLQFMLEKQKKHVKCDWLNTPNTYRKEEFEESGTQNPKKITKWVQEAATGGTTPVKVENPNQFAPQGENPKELKSKHQAIRKEYYEDKIDAGPQSKVLEGVSWEDAQKIKEGHLSGTTDSVIVVGSASKGIIQRGHQHNAQMYSQSYSANPFDNMSPDEIDAYKKDIEKKSKGGSEEPEEELTPGPDGHLISSEERNEMVKREQQAYVKPGVKETSIDDIMDTPDLAHPPAPGRGGGGDPRTPTRSSKPVPHGVPVLPSAPIHQRPPISPRQTTQPAVAYQQQYSPQQQSPYYQQQQQQPSSGRHSVPVTPTTPTGQTDFGRSASARYPAQRVPVSQEEGNFERSKSERKWFKKKASQPVNGNEPAGSPTKSTSSGEGTLEEGSPSKEAKPEKKKKKKFRMPSFSSKKKDKAEKKAATEQ